jgi:hypothetical protein
MVAQPSPLAVGKGDLGARMAGAQQQEGSHDKGGE